MLASSAGAFTALVYVWYSLRKPDVAMVCNGLLGGLVAITGPCAFVSPAAAVMIGLVAGLLVVRAVSWIERRFRVDDPVGAFSVHGVCGCWGALSLGLFADGTYGVGWNGVAGPVRGLLFGDASQLVAQLIGVVTNILFVFPVALGFFRLTDRLIGNRVNAEVEFSGPRFDGDGLGGLSARLKTTGLSGRWLAQRTGFLAAESEIHGPQPELRTQLEIAV